jgi:hypothetical protein
MVHRHQATRGWDSDTRLRVESEDRKKKKKKKKGERQHGGERKAVSVTERAPLGRNERDLVILWDQPGRKEESRRLRCEGERGRGLGTGVKELVEMLVCGGWVCVCW